MLEDRRRVFLSFDRDIPGPEIAATSCVGASIERRKTQPDYSIFQRFTFARIRIRVAHRHYKRIELYPEEWLLIEWPKVEKEPTK